MSDTTLATIEEEARRLGFRRERLRSRFALPRFADVRFVGRLGSGRRGTIGFAGVGVTTRARLSVAADEAASFSVARQGFFEWLGSVLLLEDPLHVEGAGRARVLARSALRDEISSLFKRQRALSLELARGELVVQVPFFDVPPRAYVGVLHELDLIARRFDRVSIRVKVLGGARRALGGAHGPRCAYCHGGLSGEEADLVACEHCRTVLHASCWHENARCPVLGCQGEAAESR